MTDVFNVSITDTPARYVIVGLLIFAGLYAAHHFIHRKWRHRTTVAFVAAVALTYLVYAVLELWWKPFPDAVPGKIYIAGGLSAFVIFAAAVQHGRRVIGSLMAVVAVVAALGFANLTYQQYPTLRSLDPKPQAVTMDYATYVADYGVPGTHPAPQLDGRDAGALVSVELPGVESGFHARTALAYLPPAYFTSTTPLPVLVILAGNPGAPDVWFTAGGAEAALDEYQAKHDGMSPIVVSVDGTGSFLGNPICVDGPRDKVHTYLSVDVPAQIQEKFRIAPAAQQHWTIGGLSYGGTCALQVVTNAPQVYRSFLDFSGQWEPTIGDRTSTVNMFFGGDEAAFEAVNPAELLRAAAGTEKYAGITGSFVAGESDPEAVEALSKLNDLAHNAGMDTSFRVVEGGHSYQTWRTAFVQDLDFVMEQAQLR